MREMIEIDLSPRTAWLDSVFNKHLSVEACFSELFDNAFDQDATVIEVTFGADSVTVLDDGNGIANMEHMLAFSEKPLTPRPRVGRYGVGGKYGAANLGTQLSIDTRHGLKRQKAFVDWEGGSAREPWLPLYQTDHFARKAGSGAALRIRGPKADQNLSASALDRQAHSD
jgi:hypothetical protein